MSHEDDENQVPPIPPHPDEEVFSSGGPAFLDPARATSIGYVETPDSTPDFSHWDNHVEPDPEPNKPRLKARHKELARLHALGHTNNQICEKLGYSQSRVSVLLSNPVIQREIDRYRNRLYEKDLVSAVKDLGPIAMEVVEEGLLNAEMKTKDKVEIAKWVIEKVTGKPKQEVSHESNTLAAFMDAMRQMRESGQIPQGPRELNPSSAENSDILEAEYSEQTEESGPKSGTKFDGKLDDILGDP